MDDIKLFLGVWFCVVLSVLSVMGFFKLGGAMFDVKEALPNTSDSSDAPTGCHESGGTVVAENGEYKSCSFRENN